jgi:membrane-bound serine protease (ClpP class)
MKICKYIMILALLTACLLAGARQGAAQTGAVYVMPAVGSINPGLAGFIIEGIRTAEKEQAGALVIQLDTPGGLEVSMRRIAGAIVNAKVPVIVYVSPRGARAASAGVFVTMAAHVAAMAPGTTIGAAHPVGIGVSKMDDVMMEKVISDMVAYGRSLAKERGRNADWVEQAVRKSVSVDAAEALRLKVIDFVAEDLNQLLTKANNREVKIDGKPHRLKTLEVPVREIQESLTHRILKHIADPNIAFILMMIGLAGLYFELSNPGGIFPGVLGGLCLLLALFAFQALPVNYVGLLLILLSFVFFLLEIFVSSYGLLSLGGVISLILGSMMLFRDVGEPGMEIAWRVLIPTVIVVSGFFITVAALVARSHLTRSRTGKTGLIGEEGVAHTDLSPEGQVFVHGEFWRARSDEPIAQGEPVEVVEVVGLKIKVRRAK